MIRTGLLAITLCLISLTLNSVSAQSLPGTKRDFKFERKVAKLNLEDTDKYEFHFKTGGTSIGFKVSKRGKRKSGVFAPYNSSTYPEGEVVTYRLARLLGVSDYFNPVDYYTLGPVALRKFRNMFRRERDKWRRQNTYKLHRRIQRNQASLRGIYKYRHKRRSQPAKRLSKFNRFNTLHFLAKCIQANGRQPTGKLVRLRGVTRDKKKYDRPLESERELARQLSTIFVMDMLTGQWDRFSGGNIEAIAHKDGRLQFVARDNGGASFSSRWNWYKRYSRWVSRFDRKFVTRLQGLNDFLQGDRREFQGFSDQKTLRKALGFRRNKSFRNFKKKLRALTKTKLRKLKKSYGDAMFFEEA